MRANTVFTLGFFATIVLAFWVIISFARSGAFFDPVSILGAIVGGFFVTLMARKIFKSDADSPKGPNV